MEPVLLAALVFGPPTLDRWFVAPSEVPERLGAGAAELTLQNPHRGRAVLRVDGVDLGEARARAPVRLTGLADRAREVCWVTPDGFARCATTGPRPAR